MAEATKDHSNLPQAAKPTVFHHEGRRLFLIDGEPRVVDEDLGIDLEMRRARDIRSNLIDPNRAKLLMLGDIFQVDPKARELVRVHDDGDSPQLRFENAVAEQVFALLKTEGLIDFSKPGEKPKINFLNAEQAKFLIVSSATPKGRDLLVDLIRIEKAWRDGTLGPARPAVEPPTAPDPDGRQALLEGLRASVRAKEDVDLNFFHREGIVFAAVLTRIHVLADSVAEALGMTAEGFAAELARWPCLSLLAEMPELGVPHGPWLARCHVTFLLS